VPDSSDGEVPNVSITVTNLVTAVSRTVQTESVGYYSVPELPPGTYRVDAKKEGFAPRNASRCGADKLVILAND
jgi:hypothetical protein